MVPCYNEERRLDPDAFRRFVDDPDPRLARVRFLLVDDGSRDRTIDVIRALERDRPDRFRALQLARNSGKAEAVRRGMTRAIRTGEDGAPIPEVVGYWDADLAAPLDAIPDLLDILARDPRAKIVLGARVRLLGRDIDRKPHRHYLGRVFATLASLVLRLPVYDTQCGAKLFRVDDRLRAALDEPFRSRWIFDVELLARLARGRVPELVREAREFPLRRWRDVRGSNVRPTDFLKAAWELCGIARRYR